MKAGTTTLAAILAASAILASGCGKKRKKASEEVDPGTLTGSTYRNDYFGMTITFPPDWSVCDQESLRAIADTGAKVAVGENKDLKAAVEASKPQTVHLFGAFKHPMGTAVPFNPNIMGSAERIRDTPGIATGRDYLSQLRKVLRMSQASVRFPKRAYSETVGGVDFDVLSAEMTIGAATAKQKYYATIRKGYALFVVVSFKTSEEESALNRTVQSMTFE